MAARLSRRTTLFRGSLSLLFVTSEMDEFFDEGGCRDGAVEERFFFLSSEDDVAMRRRFKAKRPYCRVRFLSFKVT
jgi:hypothetical protein